MGDLREVLQHWDTLGEDKQNMLSCIHWKKLKKSKVSGSKNKKTEEVLESLDISKVRVFDINTQVLF